MTRAASSDTLRTGTRPQATVTHTQRAAPAWHTRHWEKEEPKLPVPLHRHTCSWLGHCTPAMETKGGKPEFVEILNIFFLSFPFTFCLSTHSKDPGRGSTPLVLWWFRIPPPGAGQPRSSELELVMGTQETPGVPCAPCSSLRLLPCPGIPNRRCCRPAATQSPGDESIRIFRAENKWVTTNDDGGRHKELTHHWWLCIG